jgi:hypothetical protein
MALASSSERLPSRRTKRVATVVPHMRSSREGRNRAARQGDEPRPDALNLRPVPAIYSGSPLIRYMAPMSWPAVLMDPNHFS